MSDLGPDLDCDPLIGGLWYILIRNLEVYYHPTQLVIPHRYPDFAFIYIQCVTAVLYLNPRRQGEDRVRVKLTTKSKL